MGSNKTYQQNGERGRMLGESVEFRKLRHAIEKAHDDRDRAIRNVCRLYAVNRLDALPKRDPDGDTGPARGEKENDPCGSVPWVRAFLYVTV
jgi:hypothetical protein